MSAQSVSSEQWRRWVEADNTSDPLIFLITISHAMLSEPIRVSSDMTELLGMHADLKEPIYGTKHNGENYYAFPFKFTLPDVPDSTATTKASFSLCNVSQEYTAQIRNLDSAPLFEVKMVFASRPNIVEKTLPPMYLESIEMTATTITGDLAPADFRYEPFPKLKFMPSAFQGLFA